MAYINKVLEPNFIRRGKGINRMKAVLILHGVITHCSHKLITWFHINNIILVLSPPNTSSSTQPEDVIIFEVLKKEWVDFKNECLLQRIF